MNYGDVRNGLDVVLLLGGMASLVVAYVVANRKSLVPSPGFGWLVTDSVSGGDGIPSMIVIDCFCGGGRPSGVSDALSSFTVRAQAGQAAQATIHRMPSGYELPSNIAARRAVIVAEEKGVWRVDASLMRGSALRIRLFDVDVGATPMLAPSTEGIRVEHLDRKTLGLKLGSVGLALAFFPIFVLWWVSAVASRAAPSSPTTGDWRHLALETLATVCICWSVARVFHAVFCLRPWFRSHLALNGFSRPIEFEVGHAQST